jgi:hypothetical protein
MQTTSGLKTEVRLAPAHASHFDAIAAMFWHAKVASNGKFLRELTSFEAVAAWLADPVTHSTVALLGDVVVGHIGLMENSPAAATWGLTGPWSQVSRLCVDPVARHQGVGETLVHSVLGKRMFASVQEGSASHLLLVRCGMDVRKSIVFPNNPAPGLLLVS